jgi:acetyl-CoA acetyltransferase family protein
MRSITAAALAIQAGRTDVVVAGGTESMSLIPLLFSARMTELFVRLLKAKTVRQRVHAIASFRPAHLRPVIAHQLGLKDPVCELNMGQTAEVLAREFGVTREDQDRFALESHRKAARAWEMGAFAAEVAAVDVPPASKRDKPGRVERDESVRADSTLEALAKLRPVFRKDGSVTAGNSSPLNDGAAAVLLTSSQFAERHGLRPRARIVASAVAGVDPSYMGIGPIPATRKALERAGITAADLDIVELNEAFAAQSLACIRELDLDPTKVNVHGGAIALGHPIGCTGARIVATLVHAMERHSARRGLATLCIGVGQGLALVVERVGS